MARRTGNSPANISSCDFVNHDFSGRAQLGKRTVNLAAPKSFEAAAVTFIERLSFRKRFESPATLALFGAFAVPEPFGTIILAYAAFWWWRSRKSKAAGLRSGNEPPLATDIAQRAPDGAPPISVGSRLKKMWC